MARFLQRSRRNLSPSSEHAGNTGQGPKRKTGAESAAPNHLPLEQVGQQFPLLILFFLYFFEMELSNISFTLISKAASHEMYKISLLRPSNCQANVSKHQGICLNH